MMTLTSRYAKYGNASRSLRRNSALPMKKLTMKFAAAYRMAKELSTARFIALLSLRMDLGRRRKVPDPLPKAKQIVISDWPRKNAQLLLRLIRGLAGREEICSLRDVEGMNHETLSLALGLTMAASTACTPGINGKEPRRRSRRR